jgi:hypothetical protein
MKTVEQWLNELPKGLRKKAFENLLRDCKDDKETSMASALRKAFGWAHTKEGFEFWLNIYNKYVAIDRLFQEYSSDKD